MTATPFVRLEGLTRRFEGGGGVTGLTLSIDRNEIVALLGPSGSGKTTTLRLLAGFESPDSGRIVVDGEDVAAMPPVVRRFGMVFQHYALFPHLDVGGNIAFGLDGRRLTKAERDRRVREALAAVDLVGTERRAVAELSGGQQQRVALARALAPEPRVLLLDEPLSNLDPSLRERTRRELRTLIRRIGITTVLVTHEQEEAFDLADRIALLNRGLLEQWGPPEELYHTPASPFVATFIGRATPVPAEVVGIEGGVGLVRLSPGAEPLRVPVGDWPRGPLTLYARPEAFHLAAAGAAPLTGEIVERRFLGATALLVVRVGAAEVEVLAPYDSGAPGTTVGLVPTGRGLFLFPEQR
ncbi:MAG: ABC transporter ATP-binding protein [Gemmatimonadota bacterium]